MFRFPPIRLLLLPALLLTLTGCAMQTQWKEESSETVRRQDLQGLPYHPLVYHLDLSVFAYQLYSQSLVFPFDPYYEELDNLHWDRTKFMAKVHTWANAKGREQVARSSGLDSFRGPGALAGIDNNPLHDPILFRYDRLHPWSHTITNPGGTWTEYLTPKEITGSIRDVYVCYRVTGGKHGEVALERLPARRRDSGRGARDVLLAFEGGTGDKGLPGQPASQSLMGFVLLRHFRTGGDYDVHIAFRGSRSGSAERAVLQANWTHSAKGNPDWITDLGYTYIPPEEGGAHISTTGKVAKGFAYSMDSILPQLIRSLRKVTELKSGRPPERIYVTGHSLGGALAQHCVSAVLLGDRYGPGGSGNAMPGRLRAWPWKQIKLITFGAPRAGDAQWARTLTSDGLDSEVFSTSIDSFDRRALPVAHPSIVPRLTDKARPAAYRAVLTKDPVSTSRWVGGKHVGKTVYVNKPSLRGLLTPWSFNDHEPPRIRKLMLGSLADPRIPSINWRYHEMTEVNPQRDKGARGSIAEFQKLEVTVHRYYRENNLWFDHSALERDFDLHRRLLQSPAPDSAIPPAN